MYQRLKKNTSMNYQLAKQLKDAGFPQYREPQLYPRDMEIGKVVPTMEEVMIAGSYVPDIEELFEQIGENFGKLLKDGNQFYAYDKERTIDCEGDSPRDVLAMLYIALSRDKRIT